MSRFLSSRHSGLTPYTPGEQPRGVKYIKLNTNESPYPPCDEVIRAAEREAGKLNLYSDPELNELREAASIKWNLPKEGFIMTNGSDEVLGYAFLAFGDNEHGFAFPNLTYGFYRVFAELYHIPYTEIPVRPDFSINPDDYTGIGKNIVIANPNAPSGLCLSVDIIKSIAESNSDNVVIIDEAYIDFGGESVLPLVNEFPNLLVTRTFSKSYSLAGARLGFGAASPELIRDLNTIKYSLNPYNVNRMTSACGVAAIENSQYFEANCKKIIETRERTKAILGKMGFLSTDSKANFLFIRHPRLDTVEYYKKLRSKGILTRYLGGAAEGWLRVTIGTDDEMERFLSASREILSGE